MTEQMNELRREAWNDALHTFGKGYIFDKRSGKYARYINLLKVFGIITPVTVGAAATGYGYDSATLKATIALAIPATIIQLLISVFSIVFKWDDELVYAYEASQEYSHLSASFKQLGVFPPSTIEELQHRLELVRERYQGRTKQDAKHNVSEIELRKGMRYALREFQRKCVACGEIPTSMDATNCDVCGNFKNNFLRE